MREIGLWLADRAVDLVEATIIFGSLAGIVFAAALFLGAIP